MTAAGSSSYDRR